MHAPGPEQPTPPRRAADERAFYRDELAGRAIVVSITPAAGPDGPALCAESLAELSDIGARTVLVRLASDADAVPIRRSDVESPGVLLRVWDEVRDTGRATVAVDPGPDDDGSAVADLAAALAVRLGVHKLVLTHALDLPALDTRGFIDEADLDAHPDFAVPAWAGLVTATRSALAGGVSSVNLCHVEDIEQELFTYEGAGMLVTAVSYLDVGPLRVDEFDAVDRLLRQGQAEGFLRPRSDDELTRFLFVGLGARIATTGHLAGVVGLETERYASSSAGEVVGLYAISRFTGEGVGRQLVAALLDRAAAAGLAGVFAVTTSDAVVAFFERCGFVPVDPSALPDEKWSGYDERRRASVTAVWHDLADRGG